MKHYNVVVNIIEQVIKINLKYQLWRSRLSVVKKVAFWHSRINFDRHCAHIKRFAMRISFHKFLWHFISSDKHTWLHIFFTIQKNWFKIEFNFSPKIWIFQFIKMFYRNFHFQKSIILKWKISLIVSAHTRWLLLIGTLEQQQAIISSAPSSSFSFQFQFWLRHKFSFTLSYSTVRNCHWFFHFSHFASSAGY